MFYLGESEHLIFLIARKVFNRCRGRHKLNCIGLANDLADILGLEVLLANISRLIVEQAVRVAHPCDTAEENPKNTDYKHKLGHRN